MSLNIKNPRTVALARRLADATGQSQTSAITEALELRLAEVDASRSTPDGRLGEVERLLTEIHRSMTSDERRRLARAAGDLYDEAGLPR